MGDPAELPLAAGVAELPLEEIEPGGDQPRVRFEEQPLAELAQSIAAHGVLQPILVERVGQRYRIIAGERRFRAAQRAGLQKIPAAIRAPDDDDRLTLALIENIQREDLSPLEEANAYRRIIDMTGMSQEELAARVGKHRSTVANSLRLLGLPEQMRDALADGTISAGHARAVLMIPDPAERQRLFARLAQYSVREAEAYATRVRKRLEPGGAGGGATGTESGPRPPADPHLRDLEQRLIDALGTRVRVTGTARRGKIEIAFFNADDLDRLGQRLTGDPPGR
jgi:ParB family chromosome partitioning protein